MRNATPRETSPQRSPKLARTEIETMQRRRVEQFKVLSAIAHLVPDVEGRASGTLHVEGIATSAGVSRKAVGRALEHWRRWRVLGCGRRFRCRS